jgi:hypothetical protein
MVAKNDGDSRMGRSGPSAVIHLKYILVKFFIQNMLLFDITIMFF